MEASSRGAVNFTFTATYGRKLCAGYTATSRKVVGKNVHSTTQRVSMGYDQYTVPHTVAIEPTVFVFIIALANARQWTLLPFFQISLKNSELKNTHNTFRVFSRSLFSTTFLEKAEHYGSSHGARGWAQKQVIKHYSIAPKDLDIKTRFVLKNSRNKFDWLVREMLLLGELIMSNKE